MNAFLRQVKETRSTTAPDGSTVNVDSEISEAEGALLQRVIRKVRPARSLEIGCRYGVSTHYICESLREVGAKEHVIIDAGQRLGVKNLGLYNVLKEGFGDLVSLYTEQSQLALPWFVERGHRFDFALIDGAHTFDHTLVDFFFVDKLLKKTGVVVFDDADWPGIRKLCRFVATNRHYEIIDWVGITPGADFFAGRSSMVAMMKKEDDLLPQTRAWDHFVDF